jgi:hypothetical protein
MVKVFTFCSFVFVSCFVAVVVIEFLVGCGEKVYYQNKTWQTNSCVFLPHKVKRGVW